MATLVTDSHVRTSTNVALVYVVRTLLAQISQVASHAPALIVSRVMRWTAVLTFANVVMLIFTHVTLMCIDFKGGCLCECLYWTYWSPLVMALHALISTNVPIPKMYQLTPFVQIQMVALLSFAIPVSKWLTTSDDFGFFSQK